MPGLESTIARLARFREMFGRHGVEARGQQLPRLREHLGFGSNPGDLRMHMHVPATLPRNPALVVALHGCMQTAAQYDHGTGWSDLADAHGFVVVFPEQQPVNNPNRCFNWFLQEDTRRDSGEAHSIREMIEHAIVGHCVDRRRIHVSGLSAGGAMTAALLAAYPDVFASGAILAGLPAGAAGNVREALDVMAAGPSAPAAALVDHVLAASPHVGSWPKVSIWHGGADAIVAPANADASLAQWLGVHGLESESGNTAELATARRRVWTDARGTDLIEHVIVSGMGHGVPVAADGAGQPGPFFLKAGVSATDHLTRFFGIADPKAEARAAAASRERAKAEAQAATGSALPHLDPAAIVAAALERAGLFGNAGANNRQVPDKVRATIEAALKAAGLGRNS